MLNVFTRRDGKLHRFYATELVFLPGDPDQNQRHIDMASAALEFARFYS